MKKINMHKKGGGKTSEKNPSMKLPVLKMKFKNQPIPPTLDEMDISIENLESILSRAKPEEWVIANYIPALEDDVEWNPTDTAIGVADMHWNFRVIGKAQNTIVSAQSTVKVFLYLFALYKWADPKNIAFWEPVAKRFNQDPITGESSGITTAYHPLNNAGWISSASEITNRKEFMDFMKTLTGNPNLSILQNVYESEKKNWESNLRIAAALATKGRFGIDKMIPALDNYTKACSIGLSVKDLTNMGLVLARWWMGHNGQRVFDQDCAVRAMNAMNWFWFYDLTGRTSLFVAWSRALTAKSWVWWLIFHVNPGIWSFVTLWRHLDESWNSVFGMKVAIPLNDMLWTSWAMRLSPEETSQMLGNYIRDVQEFTVHEAIVRKEKKHLNQDHFFLKNLI